MADVSKASIIGRLGNDPKLFTTANSKAVCSFPVATCETWKSKDGQTTKNTTWHNVVAFGRTAEIAHQYLNKGSQVYIEGQLTQDNYTDKDGVQRFVMKIKVRDIQFLDNKNSKQSVHDESKGGGLGSDDFDDDMPF